MQEWVLGEGVTGPISTQVPQDSATPLPGHHRHTAHIAHITSQNNRQMDENHSKPWTRPSVVPVLQYHALCYASPSVIHTTIIIYACIKST